jgi:uncharacterized membrane protein YuzA (DUF378 family)
MDSFQKMLIMKKIEMLSLLLIVIGALNWGFVGLFKFDIIVFIAKKINWKDFAKWVYILVGIAALIHIFSRNYYLPFLGDAVFPCNSLVEKVPENATMSVKIQTKPNVNVIYWGAEENHEVRKNPWVAYAEYSNTGVAKSDVNGIAILRFRKPASYFVKGYKQLAPHVHYRVCSHPGMMDEVQTVYVV